MLKGKSDSARARALAFFCLTLLSTQGLATALGPPVFQAAPADVIWDARGIAEPPRRGADLETLRALIEHSRQTGDLRALGRAKAIVDTIDTPTAEHTVLAATIAQRLHHFDDAKTLLLDVLAVQPNHRQALFTLYSIALVQGDYDAAAPLCEAMSRHGLDWLAVSCHFNLMGLQGNPVPAFNGLRGAIDTRPGDNSVAYHWALATLAELAATIDHPDTDTYYRQVLVATPNDHYSASEYADWLLHKGRARQAYAVLSGRPDSDRLLLLRAIALQKMGDARADSLATELAKRFERASLRQDNTHNHERARYLLDIAHQTDAALTLAERNFAQQKERADRRLLQRARAAVGDAQ